MYSPRWLYLVPGFLLLGVGLILAFALLFAPLKLANIALDLNTLLVACCLAITGAQLITFGALSLYFAVKSGFRSEPGDRGTNAAMGEHRAHPPARWALFVLGLVAFGYRDVVVGQIDFGNLVSIVHNLLDFDALEPHRNGDRYIQIAFRRVLLWDF